MVSVLSAFTTKQQKLLSFPFPSLSTHVFYKSLRNSAANRTKPEIANGYSIHDTTFHLIDTPIILVSCLLKTRSLTQKDFLWGVIDTNALIQSGLLSPPFYTPSLSLLHSFLPSLSYTPSLSPPFYTPSLSPTLLPSKSPLTSEICTPSPHPFLNKWACFYYAVDE